MGTDMKYTVIEASENHLPGGAIELVETLLYEDGTEAIRRCLPGQRLYKTCSLCGLKSDKEEFPRSAMGCSRSDCL
jgi:hypothetical protein